MDNYRKILSKSDNKLPIKDEKKYNSFLIIDISKKS